MMSYMIRQNTFIQPMVDIGCGDGTFSFVTAGGQFDPAFDLFTDVALSKRDIYSAQRLRPPKIKRHPDYIFEYGLDHQGVSLRKASQLAFYNILKNCNATKRLSIASESMNTVFSN